MLLKWTPADFSSFKLTIHFEDYEAMRDPQWVLRNDSHERERQPEWEGWGGGESGDNVLLPVYSAIRW